MTNYDVIAESMFKPFIAGFDHYMRAHALEPHKEHPNEEDITKAAAKAVFMIEKVVRDAGGPFKKTYEETIANLKNGQDI